MIDVLPWLAALGLCHAGMTALSLAMRRHYRQIRGKIEPSPASRLSLRGAGWLQLVVSMGVCLYAWGSSVGAVAWMGVLTAASLIVILQLSYVPRMALIAVSFSPVFATIALTVLLLW